MNIVTRKLNLFSIGAWSFRLSGLFPLTLGLINFFNLPLNPSPSFESVSCQSALWGISRIGYTNLIYMSVSVIYLSWHLLPKRILGVYLLLCFAVAFVAINDLWVAYYFYFKLKYGYPIPAIPTALGVIGAACCAPTFFYEKNK